MALGFNLSNLVSVPALILNANIISLSVKPPMENGSLEKIYHISRVPIFGGSDTVQP